MTPAPELQKHYEAEAWQARPRAQPGSTTSGQRSASPQAAAETPTPRRCEGGRPRPSLDLVILFATLLKPTPRHPPQSSRSHLLGASEPVSPSRPSTACASTCTTLPPTSLRSTSDGSSRVAGLSTLCLGTQRIEADAVARERPAPATATIAYKPQHKARSSLLGAQSYSQLHAGSFSSEHHLVDDPYYPPAAYNDRDRLYPAVTNTKAAARSKPPKMYIPNSTWTWSFTIVVVAQALIALALEGYVFGEFETSLKGDGAQNQSPAHTIPTYLALFIFGFIYQLILTWDALRMKNTIQVIGLCLYNYGMMIYAAVEMDQVDVAVTSLRAQGFVDDAAWSELRPFLVAAPCVIALASVLMSAIAWKLYQEFAWSIYKNISADLRMTHRYKTYQIYIALLKFDFFFFLGFTVQFLVIIGNNFTDAEVYLTIAAIPITIVLLLLAALFTRRETYIGQSFIICIYFAAMGYFVFKLVRMYDASDPMKVNEYLPARTSLTTFAIITMLLLAVTIVSAIWCMRNFKKGLKPYINHQSSANRNDNKLGGPYGDESYGQQLGNVPARMTID